MERLLEQFPIDDTGVFQIPHHGSKDNWQGAFLGKTPRNYVVSVGMKNTYHHPDYWVMEAIRAVPKNELGVVTEKSDPWKKTYDIR